MKKFLIALVFISIAFIPSYTKVHAAIPTSTSSTIYDDPSGGTYNDTASSSPDSASTTPTTTSTSQNSCSTLNSSNYSDCCAPDGGGSSAQCDSYEQALENATVPGQLMGGSAQTTNPVNSGASTNLTTTNATYPGVVDNATSCSAIQFRTLLDFAIWAKCIIGAIVIPGIFTLAFVVFLWGVFKFIRASDKADKDDSKQFIYMGLIGLFVMTSVWGIIKIISTTLGVGSVVPTLQTDYLSTSNASTSSTSTTVPTSVSNGASL